MTQRPDISFDDNFGLRNASAVPNSFGISQFAIVLSTKEVLSFDELKTLPPTEQEYRFPVSMIGDSVMYLHLAAVDILGNNKV